MVDDDDIGMALQALGGNLKLCAQQLVQMANDNGGRGQRFSYTRPRPSGYPAREA